MDKLLPFSPEADFQEKDDSKSKTLFHPVNFSVLV